MTPEEIKAMEPGRELDRLIRIHLYGDIDDTWKWFEAWGNHQGYNWVIKDDESAWQALSKYSSDISAAWEVVEKFKNEGYLFSLKNLVGGKYEFTLTDWGRKCDVFSGQGETAPEAICKAALLAVLGEGKV